MAKLSSINKNERRKKLVKKYAGKYARLKAIADNETADETERLMARLKMAEIPRNGNPTRVRNRCNTTGRPRGYYRKFGINRIELRNLGNKGLIPGLVKSSW
jgi:small subunit ribosomal protein S14